MWWWYDLVTRLQSCAASVFALSPADFSHWFVFFVSTSASWIRWGCFPCSAFSSSFRFKLMPALLFCSYLGPCYVLRILLHTQHLWMKSRGGPILAWMLHLLWESNKAFSCIFHVVKPRKGVSLVDDKYGSRPIVIVLQLSSCWRRPLPPSFVER